MDNISNLAAQWGVAAEYFDAFGNRRVVGGDALARIVDAISGGCRPAHRVLPATIVARRNRQNRVEIVGHDPDCRIHWEILSDGDTIARGAGEGPAIVFPDIPVGTYRLRVTVATIAGESHETATLLVAPNTTF